MKARFLTAVLVLASLSLMSCESTEESVVADQIAEEEVVNNEVIATSTLEAVTINETCIVNTVFDSVYTEEDEAGLLQMREEEKLAGDVYTYFYNLYKYPVFLNISKSEAVHSNAVLYLINSFGLTDPATTEIGVFTNPDIQALYNDLTAKGAVGIVEALSVGAFIEEYDIKDLEEEIASTTNANIIRVYSNLMRGSTFHLKAFTRLLKIKGVVYEPQILTNEEYVSIID